MMRREASGDSCDLKQSDVGQNVGCKLQSVSRSLEFLRPKRDIPLRTFFFFSEKLSCTFKRISAALLKRR